jgi:phage gp37-like protein
MPTITAPASAFDLSAAPTLFELRGGAVRLRPHLIATPAILCDVALGPFVIPATARAIRYQEPDLALGQNFVGAMTAIAPGITPFTGYEALNNTGFFFLDHAAAQRNVNEFTIHHWFKATSTTVTGHPISEYTAVNGMKRWKVYIVSATRVRLELYDAAGTMFTTGLDLNPLSGSASIANGDILYLKFGYQAVGAGTSNAFIRLYRWGESSSWTLLGSGSTSAAPLMPTLVAEENPGLTLHGSHAAAGGISSDHIGATYSVRRYTAYDASAESYPTAPASIYATTQAGAVVTLDAGEDDATWDLSTLAVDDETQWAASVGVAGYTLKYEIANSPAGSWSSELTLAGFRAAADAAGRYLKIQLTCVSSGLANYQIRHLGCSVTPPEPDPLPSPPEAPVLVSCTRNGDSGSLVATAEAGATVHVWGVSIFDWTPTLIEVGNGVADGAGDVTVVLNFSSVGGEFAGLDIDFPALVCITATNAAGSSPPCLTAALGLLTSTGPTVSVSSVQRSVDRLSASVTVSGAGASDMVLIGWIASSGGINGVKFLSFTGPGPHTVTGLIATDTFAPLAVVMDSSAQMSALAGWCELARIPAAAPVTARGSLTYTEVEDAVLARLSDLTTLGAVSVESYGGQLSDPKVLADISRGKFPRVYVQVPRMRCIPENRQTGQEITVVVYVADHSTRGEAEARRGDNTVSQPGAYELIEAVRDRLSEQTLSATVDGTLIQDGKLELMEEQVVGHDYGLRLCAWSAEYRLRRKVKV